MCYHKVEVDCSHLPVQKACTIIYRLPKGTLPKNIKATVLDMLKLEHSSAELYRTIDGSLFVNPVDSDEFLVFFPVEKPYVINVHLFNGETFHMTFLEAPKFDDVETKISRITGILPHFMELVNAVGRKWEPDLQQDVWVNTLAHRGGARTVSSTQEYVPQDAEAQHSGHQEDQEEDPEPDNQWRQHQIEAAFETQPHNFSRSHSRSRSRRTRRSTQQQSHRRERAARRERDPNRSLSPTTSINERPPSQQHHGWWSEVQPRLLDPPSAQDEPIPRTIYEETQVIGFIWAHPLAVVGQVIQEFADQEHIEPLISIIPMGAVLWNQLHYLELMGRPVVQRQHYLELRETRWELFATPREAPIMYQGEVVHYATFPAYLTIAQVQLRLDYTSPWSQIWTITALDAHNWVIVERDVPASIMRDAYDMQSINLGITRGGMRPTAQQPDSPTIHNVWVNGMPQEYVVTWVALAHCNYTLEPYPSPYSSSSPRSHAHALSAVWSTCTEVVDLDWNETNHAYRDAT